MGKDIAAQEEGVQRQAQDLRAKANEMQRERAKLEEERIRVYEECHNIQRKLEDEIKLRLFFEQKLNSLHHVNMKHESNLTRMRERYEKMAQSRNKIVAEYDQILEEHKELKLYKKTSGDLLKEYGALEQAEKAVKEEREAKLTAVFSELDVKKRQVEDLQVDNTSKNFSLIGSQASVRNLANSLKASEEYAQSLKNLHELSKEEIERQE